MDASAPTLAELGWTPFFARQLSDAEQRGYQPVRVMAVHRGMVAIAGDGLDCLISSILADPQGPIDRATVGDWVLLDPEDRRIVRILARRNLFKRPEPGNARRIQLIAANVDDLLIVTSCNQDFNIARLERYLVLAREVGVNPVIVLTKIDLAEAPETFLDAARTLQDGLEVEMVNARDFESVSRLAARCDGAKTVALVGSSGVGKSTLVNSLRRSDSIATQEVREADGKGRHTTTVRQMHRLGTGPEGGWLVDTPGMREFQLSDATTGLADVFDDVAQLALECRFTNCTHGAEPGCAIRAAIAAGTLEPDRLARWRKLTSEDTTNTEHLAARRSRAGKPDKRS